MASQASNGYVVKQTSSANTKYNVKETDKATRWWQELSVNNEAVCADKKCQATKCYQKADKNYQTSDLQQVKPEKDRWLPKSAITRLCSDKNCQSTRCYRKKNYDKNCQLANNMCFDKKQVKSESEGTHVICGQQQKQMLGGQYQRMIVNRLGHSLK